MAKSRQPSRHLRWSWTEVEIIRKYRHLKTTKELMEMIPGRTAYAIYHMVKKLKETENMPDLPKEILSRTISEARNRIRYGKFTTIEEKRERNRKSKARSRKREKIRVGKENLKKAKADEKLKREQCLKEEKIKAKKEKKLRTAKRLERKKKYRAQKRLDNKGKPKSERKPINKLKKSKNKEITPKKIAPKKIAKILLAVDRWESQIEEQNYEKERFLLTIELLQKQADIRAKSKEEEGDE